jgi:hypothetical protein
MTDDNEKENKIQKSNNIKNLKSSLSEILKNPLIKNSIYIIILSIIAYIVLTDFFGPADFSKPFHKSFHEANYEAYLTKTENVVNVEKIQVHVSVQRRFIFWDKIRLDYIYYDGKDFEFYDYDEILLVTGEFVPVLFHDNNTSKDHNWYVMMTDKKVSDVIYAQ